MGRQVSLQTAQHTQSLEARETSGNRGNPLFGVGHQVELGLSRGRSLAHGVGSASLSARSLPARHRGRLHGASSAPPAQWSRGRRGI